VASKRKNGLHKARRKRGRPLASQEGVGRDGVIAAARKLLETLPPHRITLVMIARRARVDPALIRYYFASREALLLAVAENLASSRVAIPAAPSAGPAETLANQLSGTIDFARKVRCLQRLMIDECAEAKSPEIRRRVQELTATAVQVYAALFDQNQPDPLVPADPLLAYVALIGMCEFFVAAQPLIVPLLPQKISAEELAERYKKLIVKMVLDGLRPRRNE
jgi:TetR/AcrR family transcriptional regulator